MTLKEKDREFCPSSMLAKITLISFCAFALLISVLTFLLLS